MDVLLKKSNEKREVDVYIENEFITSFSYFDLDEVKEWIDKNLLNINITIE